MGRASARRSPHVREHGARTPEREREEGAVVLDRLGEGLLHVLFAGLKPHQLWAGSKGPAETPASYWSRNVPSRYLPVDSDRLKKFK